MPLNTLRLNHQKSSHPNDRIVFIKPLPRPSDEQSQYDLADTFLRAIAAQCLPLMKTHFLSVTTLEEHEPNREFIGRNFNNGEIVQLVLRSHSGHWLPFHTVQMVMMHELAHNTHMNHGRDFWKTRNIYAEEMKGLWSQGYTGEGFWGSGRTFSDLSEVMSQNVVRSDELAALPLCGGTFRSRRRKRRRVGDGANAPEMTWKEKRDRRIEKKFGKNGVSLGEDEDKRFVLEMKTKGPIGGKPRVAQSKRGRELRAAAALARFGTNKQEVDTLKKEKQEDVAEEDDNSDYEDIDTGEADARDTNGERILDGHGNGMIKVCDDEDIDDVHVKQEMEELEGLDRYWKWTQAPNHDRNKDGRSKATSIKQDDTLDSGTRPRNETQIKTEPTDQATYSSSSSTRNLKVTQSTRTTHQTPPTSSTQQNRPSQSRNPPSPTNPTNPTTSKPPQPAPSDQSKTETTCPICSLTTPTSNISLTCQACSHVLYPDRGAQSWKCQSQPCLASEKGREYVNAGDVRRCGLCFEVRSKV